MLFRSSTFCRRYEPIELDQKDWRYIRDWKQIPEGTDVHYVWTVVDVGTRSMILCPGYRTVNYAGRVLCAKPWPEEEEGLPGYYY